MFKLILSYYITFTFDSKADQNMPCGSFTYHQYSQDFVEYLLLYCERIEFYKNHIENKMHLNYIIDNKITQVR